MASRGGGSKYGFLNVAPLFDTKGTTLTLGTASGSITFPTNPRPHNLGLYAILDSETFVRMRLGNASGGGDDSYYPENVFTIQALHPTPATLDARVESGAGTLYVTYYFGGSVT